MIFHFLKAFLHHRYVGVFLHASPFDFSTADPTVWHQSNIEWFYDPSFFYRFLEMLPGPEQRAGSQRSHPCNLSLIQSSPSSNGRQPVHVGRGLISSFSSIPLSSTRAKTAKQTQGKKLRICKWARARVLLVCCAFWFHYVYLTQ